MQGLTENHILWRGLPVKTSYLLGNDSHGKLPLFDSLTNKLRQL